MTQTTVINLHPNVYNEEFHYYPFPVKLDGCVRSCSILNKVCVANFNEKIITCKTQNFCILHAVLYFLRVVALLIVISIWRL